MGTPHRTECYDVFFFDQLNEEAKEKAREWWRSCEQDDPSWIHERRQSMQKFCDVFDVREPSYEYDSCSYDIGRVRVDDQLEEMSGGRLAAYLWNKCAMWLVTPRVYELPNGSKRASKIQLVDTSCPFTGYCADESLLDPIRKFMKAGSAPLTYQQLMEDCLHSWGRTCRDDMAWILADEQVDEAIIANEYEFGVSGSRV